VNQYIWRHVAHTELLLDEKNFVIRKEDEDRFRFYIYGNVKKSLERIRQMPLWKPKHVYFLSSQISAIAGNDVVQEDESQHEYLYRYERIRGFQGKLLQKKGIT
jgi:hypothetical protein